MTVADIESRECMQVHTNILYLHIRALACHCECLGMNAGNMWAAIRDESPPYSNESYNIVLRKWGLMDDNDNPLI